MCTHPDILKMEQTGLRPHETEPVRNFWCSYCEQEKFDNEMSKEDELCESCLDGMKDARRENRALVKLIKKWTDEAILFHETDRNNSVTTVLMKICEYLKGK